MLHYYGYNNIYAGNLYFRKTTGIKVLLILGLVHHKFVLEITIANIIILLIGLEISYDRINI